VENSSSPGPDFELLSDIDKTLNSRQDEISSSIKFHPRNV
jgi:hypothetical protein